MDNIEMKSKSKTTDLIQICKEATENIDSHYYEVETLKGGKKHFERRFAYELYHQIRCKDIKNSELSPELKKEDLYFTGLSLFNYEKPPGELIPDLVIHQFMTTAKNGLVIEIKTDPNTSASEIYEDLMKLAYYCEKGKSRLNYNAGILIIANLDVESKIKVAYKIGSEILKLLNLYNNIRIWKVIPNQQESKTIITEIIKGNLRIFFPRKFEEWKINSTN